MAELSPPVILSQHIKDLSSEQKILLDLNKVSTDEGANWVRQLRLWEIAPELQYSIASASRLRENKPDTSGTYQSKLESLIDKADKEFQSVLAIMTSGEASKNPLYKNAEASDYLAKIYAATLAKREAYKDELARLSSSVKTGASEVGATEAAIIAWTIEESNANKALDRGSLPTAESKALEERIALAARKKKAFNAIAEREMSGPGLPPSRGGLPPSSGGTGNNPDRQVSSQGVVVSIPPFTVSNIPQSIYGDRVGFAPSSTSIKSIKVKAPVNVYTPLPSITVKK